MKILSALTTLGLASALAFAQAPAKPKPAAPAPAPAPAPKPAAAPAPKAAPAGAFLGNKDSKVFHKADCKTAEKMKESNKVSFASAAEATKAGFKACKVCKP